MPIARPIGSAAYLSRVRQLIQIDTKTSAVAFVTTWPPRANPRREVTIWVSTNGAYPLYISFDLYRLPVELAHATDAEVPKLALDYMGFKAP
jgi:hypothetical protein